MVKTFSLLILLIFGFSFVKGDNQRSLSLQAFRNKITNSISNDLEILPDFTNASNNQFVISSPTVVANSLNVNKNNNIVDQFQKNPITNLSSVNSTTFITSPSSTKNEVKIQPINLKPIFTSNQLVNINSIPLPIKVNNNVSSSNSINRANSLQITNKNTNTVHNTNNLPQTTISNNKKDTNELEKTNNKIITTNVHSNNSKSTNSNSNKIQKSKLPNYNSKPTISVQQQKKTNLNPDIYMQSIANFSPTALLQSSELQQH